MNFTRVVALFLAAVVAVSASAAEKRPLTPQDLWAIKRVSAPALSPDGKTAVIVVQEWSIEKNKPTSSLWLVDVASATTRRLTTAPVSDSSPVWSPDGTRLAFTSKRGEDENASLYVMRTDGGEPEKIIEFPSGLSSPQWLPDGQSIVVVTTVVPEISASLKKEDFPALKKELKRRKDSKMTAKVTENRQFRYWDHYIVDSNANRLVRVNVTTREFTDLTPKWDRLFTVSGEVGYEISPDGQTIALTINSEPPPYRKFPNHDVYLLPTDGSGTLKNLTPDNAADDSGPVFAPDGKSLVFSRLDIPFYSGEFTKLWKHDLATGKNSPLTESLDYAISDVNFSADGKTIWTTIEDRGVVPVFKLNADGTGLTAVYREGTSGSVDVVGSTIVFVNDTSSRPGELFALDAATGTVRQLTRFNEEFMAQIALGKVESYEFTGANNDTVHGWLVYPPNFDPAKKYPLVQLMHGGPHTMNRDSWSYRWNTHVFAAPGYVVTWVNRHGSTGFGENFSRSIINQWGDMPLEDIMKSTDFLLKKLPNLDETRMAAGGASYGGYMAARVLGYTDRFKAIINHAGVNNSYAQFGGDAPWGFPEVMGGKPWDNYEGMQRQNPMFYAKNFKTPMLVLHGELDYRVPYYQGLELYGILQALDVPSRLVVFPDENHWILKPQNAIYWHWEMQSWLSRYLGGKPTLEKPVFDAEPAAAGASTGAAEKK